MIYRIKVDETMLDYHSRLYLECYPASAWDIDPPIFADKFEAFGDIKEDEYYETLASCFGDT